MADQEQYQLTTKDSEAAVTWRRIVKLNIDEEYGQGVIKVIVALGKNLDEGMDPMEAEHQAVADSGISGYQAGVMAKAIANLHPRGAEFNRYWNEKYGVDDESGTVNPAILTIE